MKELGFSKLGDRLYMKKVVKQAKRDEADRWRNEILWTAKEVRFTKRELRCDPALGWEVEPDAKHVGRILERLNLAHDDARVPLPPGTHLAILRSTSCVTVTAAA